MNLNIKGESMRLNYLFMKPEDFTGDSLVFFVPKYEKLIDKKLKELDRATGGSVTAMLE